MIHNGRVWRTVAVSLLLLSMIGPWTYERVYMPPSVRCPPSSAHIEGDLFCGVPLPIVLEFFGLLHWQEIGSLLSGETHTSRETTQLLYLFLPLLLILPLFSSLRIIARWPGSRWRTINVIAWALAALAGSLYLHRGYFRPYPAPWGNLLYLAVALTAFVLEAWVLAALHWPWPRI